VGCAESSSGTALQSESAISTANSAAGSAPARNRRFGAAALSVTNRPNGLSRRGNNASGFIRYVLLSPPAGKSSPDLANDLG
jgi:hypothetical protein